MRGSLFFKFCLLCAFVNHQAGVKSTPASQSRLAFPINCAQFSKDDQAKQVLYKYVLCTELVLTLETGQQYMSSATFLNNCRFLSRYLGNS